MRARNLSHNYQFRRETAELNSTLAGIKSRATLFSSFEETRSRFSRRWTIYDAFEGTADDVFSAQESVSFPRLWIYSLSDVKESGRVHTPVNIFMVFERGLL